MSTTRKWGLASLIIVVAGLLAAAALLLPENDELRIDPRDASSQWLADRVDWSSLNVAVDDNATVDERLQWLWRRHCEKPRVKEFPFNFASHYEIVKHYERGMLKLPKSEPVPFDVPVSWSREDRGATFHAELHSWRFLTNLMNEYVATGEARYLETVAAIIDDWIEQNPYGDAAHPRAWHEGAVMKRTIVICGLIERMAELNDANAESTLSPFLLLKLLHQHTAFLKRDSSYVPSGNHGIRQDMALLIASLTFPEFAAGDEWRNVALSRLHEHQIKPGFTEEGVWREPSPFYHMYIMRWLNVIAELVEKNHVEADMQFLDELESRSQRYLTHVLTPERVLPPVGDTARVEMVSSLVTSATMQYVTTGGTSGAPPETLDGFFPATGVAVLRDTWGDSAESYRRSMYVHLHAFDAHTGFGHRHADELSVILYASGQWWIVDSGKYGAEKDEWRGYIESAAAHNGYLFNGEGLPPGAKPDHARVSMSPSHVSNDRMAAVRATTTRFSEESAKATRTVVLLRDRKTLVLLDELSAKSDGTWSGLHHFARDLNVRLEDGKLVATAPEMTESLQLLTAADTTPTRRIVRGQRDPLQGWVSPAHGEIEPAPTLVTDRDGPRHTVVTVIKIGAPPRLDDLQLEVHETTCRAIWRDNGERVDLSVSRAGEAFAVTLSDEATTP